MNVRLDFPLALVHRHLDVEVGPNSRSHEHDLVLRVEIDDLGFDPATGRIVDPKTGPVSLPHFMDPIGTLVDVYTGRDIADIPGIRPTFESLVRTIRERLIFFWPEARVSLRCPDEGWEVGA